MKKILFPLTVCALALFSCGNSENQNQEKVTYDAGSGNVVNVNEQQKPKLMVLPSDKLLQRWKMLKQENAQGKTILVRDFNGYLLKDQNSTYVISAIQRAFVDYGFPLDDLEQTIKQITDQDILDDVDEIQKDAKTILLTTAKPDIILELDYELRDNMASRNMDKSLTFTLRALDAFTNQVVGTIQETEFGKGSGSGPEKLMEDAIKKDGNEFTGQINKHFANIVANGRNITVRVTLEKGVSFKMDDECLDGDSYTDFIIDYMKTNTYKGAYTLTRNTSTELYFTNVKIPTLNSDGTQFSAYDFARALSKALNKGCGTKSKNKTQGLGDALISIKGM
ncbi:MAG: hypothetical protein J6W37_04680 [Bacteroidales bacterium]|nr:hypothetical protein [Bacteroidales bacterium]